MQQSTPSSLQHFFIENGPQEVHYHSVNKLTFKVMVLCFSTFYYGYNLTTLSTFTTSALETVWGPLASNPGIYGLLIGILPIGAMLGAGLAPLIMRYFSRKQFLIIINILALTVACILQIADVYILMFCRLFQGIFVGCYMAITPIYIHQIVPKQIAGSFGVFTQLFVAVGTVISYALGLMLTKTNADPFVHYRVVMSANSVLTIAQLVMLITDYVPESPCSLIRRGRQEQAKKVIGQFTLEKYVNQVYHQKYQQVQLILQGDQPIQTVQQTISANPSSNPQKIIYSARAFLLAFQLPFMQQLTGTNGITTQVNNMVAAVAPNISDYVGLVINVIKLVSTVLAVMVVTRYGRKTITLLGNLSLGLIDIGIALFFVLHSWEPSGYLIFVLLIGFNVVYGMTLGPVVWLYVPQIIPAKVVPYATMTNWLGQTICIILTPVIINANEGNPYPIFMIFGGATLLFWVVNYYLMVETKNKTKLQISRSFRKQAAQMPSNKAQLVVGI